MRIGIVCSRKDTASAMMAEHIINEYGLGERGGKSGSYGSGDITLYMVDQALWACDGADSLKMDLLFFASRHSSAGGVPALTVHSMGNWGKENRLGGMPKELSAAAPVPMLSAFRQMNGIETGIERVYEATHHGPLLRTPALFAEMGGTAEAAADGALAANAGSAVYNAALETAAGAADYQKIAIGIGGGHYPGMFSRLALERGYAFSYIMPKYAMHNSDGTGNLDMVGQAVERTKNLDVAVIDWKGLTGETRAGVVTALNGCGVEYERI